MTIAFENEASSTPSNNRFNTQSTPCTATVAFVTSGTDRIAVIVSSIETQASKGSYTHITGISDNAGIGLTWTRRGAQHDFLSHSGPYETVEMWWAYVPTAVTGKTITLSYDGQFDDGCITFYALTGLDLVTPFDPNASLPKFVSDVTGSNTTPTVTGVSTNGADSMVVAAWGTDFNSNPSINTGGGYTQISHISNTGGVNYEQQGVQEKVLSGAMSSATIAAGSATTNWGMLIDAFQAPVTAHPQLSAYHLGI